VSTNPKDYDQALVCENGHVATSMLRRAPLHNAPFCDQCGAPNISTCPSCDKPIRGAYFGGGMSLGWDPPAFCVFCGHAFPWTAAKLDAGKELIDELDLTPDEQARYKQALDEISRDTPRTELAAGRLKGLLDKVKGPVGQALYKIAVDVASAEAPRIIIGG
jgi:hypothetical protein